MKMKRFLIITAVIAMCAGALFSTKAFAIHAGAGDLVCGQCHTMHNSEGNSGMGGAANGSIVLLRGNLTARSDMHKLCLDCHAQDGGQSAVLMAPQFVTAPKVCRQTSWTNQGDFKAIGAGGDFCANGAGVLGNTPWALNTPDGSTNYSLGYGHSLGATNVTPPGSSTTISTFTCTNCHDPHGASTDNGSVFKYRNLRYSPTGKGSTSNMTALTVAAWVGAAGSNWKGSTGAIAGDYTGTAIADHYWPIANSGLTSQNSYRFPLTGGSLTDGVSAWCAQCHVNWHQESNNTDPAAGTTSGNQITESGSPPGGSDWLRHPVDRRFTDISPLSGSGQTIADWVHYTQTYGKLAAGYKLPAAVDSASTKYYAENYTDRVFCLSCHFAHGGPYPNGLRWSHAAQGNSTAQAYAIASDTGCQQCHNRGGTFGN